MHLRPDHAVRDLPTLHAFIRKHPLGLLTTSLPSENFPTLQCSHIPWILDSEYAENLETTTNGAATTEKTTDTPFLGVLRAHIARQNPQSKAMVESVTNNDDNNSPDIQEINSAILPGEVLIVFTSPVDHYISPHFYTESKPATGKVAPTWNYATVQVYGRATIYHDSKDEATGTFLRAQLTDLARLGEEGVMGYTAASGNNQRQDDIGRSSAEDLPSPWTIADAPPPYIALLKKNIVGLRVEISRIEGRFKLSQERPVNDRGGVVEGLERMESGRAREMADFVRRGGVV